MGTGGVRTARLFYGCSKAAGKNNLFVPGWRQYNASIYPKEMLIYSSSPQMRGTSAFIQLGSPYAGTTKPNKSVHP